MSRKEFLTGFALYGQKVRNKLELGGKALMLQEGTRPLFKKASEIGQGNPDPNIVKKEDERLLAKLSNILDTGKVAPKNKPRDKSSRIMLNGNKG